MQEVMEILDMVNKISNFHRFPLPCSIKRAGKAAVNGCWR